MKDSPWVSILTEGWAAISDEYINIVHFSSAWHCWLNTVLYWDLYVWVSCAIRDTVQILHILSRVLRQTWWVGDSGPVFVRLWYFFLNCRSYGQIIPYLQLADAVELLLLSVLGPVVKCQWNLSTTEEAAITSVSAFVVSPSDIVICNWQYNFPWA